MKILFFTYDFPYPANSGGKVRSYNLLKHAKRDSEIILFSFIRKGFNNENLNKLREIGINKIRIFERKERRKIFDPRNIFNVINLNSSIFKTLYFEKKILLELKKTIEEENINLVHFESFYTSFYIHDYLKNMGVKILFGEENIEYKIYQDYAKNIPFFALKPLFLLEAGKIKREEKSAWKKSDACLAVLDEEANFIQSVSGKKCYVVENGVDLSYFNFRNGKKNSQKNILFVGNFSYFPNIDAIESFYKNVFLKLADKNISFTIVGKDSSKLNFLHGNRIKTIEYIQNIKEIYYNADVFIFPIRYGGGTNFKVLEAMASGLPVVAYPDRIKALGIENKKNALIAENDEEFKNNILSLFSNNNLRENISINGRKLIEEKYSWDKIGKKLDKVWSELIK